MTTRKALLLFLYYSCSVFSQNIYSLHPKPKASFERNGMFNLNKNVLLIVPVKTNQSINWAVSVLQGKIKFFISDTLRIAHEINPSDSSYILISDYTFPKIDTYLKSVMPAGEQIPPAQGYILDINTSKIVLVGTDLGGIDNGATTLFQLFTSKPRLQNVHIWDYPDYPLRWVFTTGPYYDPTKINENQMMDTMFYRKLNGLQSSTLQNGDLRWETSFLTYISDLQRRGAERNIEIIPGYPNIGSANHILRINPNLAEGVPAIAEYVIQNDTGRLIPDTRTTLPNGSFESTLNNQFTDWDYYDGPNISVFIDNKIYHSRKTSARCTNFRQANSEGNCGFYKNVACEPFKEYYLSAWIKTERLNTDKVQLIVFGKNNQSKVRKLTTTMFTISKPSTSSIWIKIGVLFNTLDNHHLHLQAGIWGGSDGTIWWDDIQIEDASLVNILRRTGTPVTVTNKEAGMNYVEGIDYPPIRNVYVGYPYHKPPIFSRYRTGNISNGDTIVISYYHGLATATELDGSGAVMVCVSEDTLYSIISSQLNRLNEVYKTSKLFLNHDEIRLMNWDESCQKRLLTPADLLADNVTRCVDIINKIHPQSEVFIWSDMFDPLDNAYNDYCLVNGDFAGIWNLIPKSLRIVNWNQFNKKNSLNFFSKYGFAQITAPYYDVGNTSSIRSWRLAMEGIPNVLGAMYTTWSRDYRFLTPFADYMWGAGPRIIHTPFDSLSLKQTWLQFSAFVFPDEWDSTDTIDSVSVEMFDEAGNLIRFFQLDNTAVNTYSGIISHNVNECFNYRITARNRQGLRRVTPTYKVCNNITSLNEEGNETLMSTSLYQNYPNPFTQSTAIGYRLSVEDSRASGFVRLEVFDLLGRKVTTLVDGEMEAGEYTSEFKIQNSSAFGGFDIPAGIYFYRMTTNDFSETKKFIINKIR